VWSLQSLSDSGLAESLTFKGGTSLSKAFGIIDRFSEDVDLTYNIVDFVPDALRDGNPLPQTSSHAKKVMQAVRRKLPEWLSDSVVPALRASAERDGIEASISVQRAGSDSVSVRYPELASGTGYSSPQVTLEFGARATGEPNEVRFVKSDMAATIPDVLFPATRFSVMLAERTLWEKVTAAHVYCTQESPIAHRFSRHWFDIAALAGTPYGRQAVADRELALDVARHKQLFFSAKDAHGESVDYAQVVGGHLILVPEGENYRGLEADYAAMREDGLINEDAPSFSELMATCRQLEQSINGGSASMRL
jgi:hypothetical protein